MTYGSICSGIEVGHRFGRLVVTRVYAPKRSDQFRVECLCDCGAKVDTTGARLRNSKKSCGCLRRDRAGELYRTHGRSQTAQYCMFYDARKRAISQNVPFEIAPEDIQIPEVCPILGIVLSSAGPRDHRPSLDRVVPSRGYTASNIQVISFRANRIKSDASASELLAIAAYVERHS